jgi:hypothetical protein
MIEEAVWGTHRLIELCQQALRVSTGVILAAFVLIIVLTTISTEGWVQTAGKALYYIIVLDAFGSLGIWYYRTRLEKSLGDIEGEGKR